MILIKQLRREWLMLIAAAIGVAGFALEHAALEAGGALLWTLFAVVLAGVIGLAFRIAHHAEVLAVRLGEPFGTLILTVSAVAVEVIILAVMMTQNHSPTLARDTVYSAIMLDINGILGIAAIIGGLKHGVQQYNLDAANAYVAMLLTAVGIGMFIPDFVPATRWQIYSVFSVVIMAILYLAFLRLQTIEHRAFFSFGDVEAEAHDMQGCPNWLHVLLLIGAVIGVGILSELLAALLAHGLEGSGLPLAIPAVMVALISASPELMAALNAARNDRMQTTVNIALGASLATVLLTVPVIEGIALFTGARIDMALTPVQAGMLLVTFLVTMNNLHDGESNAIEGMTHFALFAAFVMLTLLGVS
ncbi:calcium:proton antiporter [Sulfuriferula sp. AH1]|uniref:calcium:proton antiporter n=1 Tax=Sulfuriferula sp. AH1 TaxID=1985873 RepID=UPI000B3B3D7D|nr:calcium:proton antiporter [Sulfuriferula sp. AH1]ARU32431.1 calcium:proton antiporter [Sulfuriferula sp. AH1]